MTWVLDLPERERTEYSTQPCDQCGWHHRLLDWRPRRRKPGTFARTLVDSGFMDLVPSGSTGEVVGWSQYGDSVSVRVEFPWLDKYDQPVRASYYPCELEI